MSAQPIGHTITFSVSRPVASKKNGRVWARHRGKPYLVPSKKAQRAASDIASAARLAIARSGAWQGVPFSSPMPFDKHDAVRIDYQHDTSTDMVHVRVSKIGELPKKGKRGTKRDSHGMVETIADAMQGVVYPDDRQVDAGSWERVR